MGPTQVIAARRLGITQPDVSKLMRGRFTGYSVDRLISLLNALAVDVDIVIRLTEKGRGSHVGTVRVVETIAG
jgi:predicted XRE-type DNA-binding protein